MTSSILLQSRQRIGITAAATRTLIDAARDASPVSGLTHDFYRYPARFSPAFVRATIEAFTKPGDLVLDPFVGGGTTLVEALALGRSAVGVDISSLATFVSKAKTMVLDERELEAFSRWSRRLDEIVNIHAPAPGSIEQRTELQRNLASREYWRLRKAIEQVLGSIERLRSERVRALARCTLLRAAQWALDTRKVPPSVQRFRVELVAYAHRMKTAAADLGNAVRQTHGRRKPRVLCLNRSTAGLEEDAAFRRVGAPKLIVTSPPYPGIHVLYHRWQVGGGKEAPAPFAIANRLDGAGSSYYTMGDRKNPELPVYFEQLETSFRSVAKICDHNTAIVQMVAFSEPEWQMRRYLNVMRKCGLEEVKPWERSDAEAGRLWRDVPNRKWHARQRASAPGAREVVLVHRKSRS